MTHPRLARRATAVSASFILAFGACGVAASMAFADATPTVPATTTAVEPTDTPESGDPTFTLTNNGAGSFSLAITIPGTSIAVDYTVDPTGAVTGATTSTAGATVAVDGHDLTVTLADGRTVKVELGDAGDAVKEVSVDEANGDNNNQDQTGDQSGDQGDNQSDNQDPASAPEPAHTQSPEPSDSSDTSDSSATSKSSKDSSGSTGSDSSGSDSGGSDSGSSDGGGN
jgi:uncharacterized membrane protein YgcG